MRLLDTRFAGFAKGVGTAPILGRIHAAVIRVGELNLQCAFTVIEGTDLNLLFGLDMLRRHEVTLSSSLMVVQLGLMMKLTGQH